MNTNRTGHLAGMNSCSVVGLNAFLDDMWALDYPCFVGGSPGIGKSNIIAAMVARNDSVLYDRRASQMLPEDFSGIPVADLVHKTTERCIPDIVAEVQHLFNTHGKPVTIFFDEINLGQMGVLSALYEVVLDRRAGNYVLPPGTRIVTAGNMASDGASTLELPRPLCNRMSMVHFMGPTFDEWADWAIDNSVHPMILTSLKVAPDFLHGKFDADAERNPTPRSWDAASKCMHLLDSTNRGTNRTDRLLRLSAYVGDEAALKVQSIYDVASRLHDPRMILKTPNTVPGHDDLALSYLQTLQLSNIVANVQNTKAAFAWVERTHPELMAVLVRAVMQRHNALKDKSTGGLINDAALLSKVSSYNRDFMQAGANIKP